MTVGPAVVWFRRDLRLHDNPAWAAATSNAAAVLPLFVLDPTLLGRAGRFRRTAMLDAVVALDAGLRAEGGALHLRRGDPRTVVPEVLDAAGASALYRNADVSPYGRTRDDAVDAVTEIDLHESWGTLVHAPGSILTDTGHVPRVFTAFWRRWRREDLPAEARAGVTHLGRLGGGETAADLVGATDPDAASEACAEARLDRFVADRLADYLDARDRPAATGTSELSVDLKRGTIGPAAAVRAARGHPAGEGFVRQLAWRDWFAHLLVETPDLVDHAQREEYERILWRDDPERLDAWKAGRTGFPIVDAGMRELAATGRMHNRVRMIAASFLVKDLLIDWRLGERYFRHVLADGDVPQNVGNWQWVAGTGPDAAPYFRVFNPTTQSRKFDPTGEYLRTWLPELAALDDHAIHEPGAVAPLDLTAAGITIGTEYPAPIVDHAAARTRAIDAYQAARA